MKRTLIRLGLTALISSALFGCGGGSDGVSGSNSVVQVSPSTPASTIATNASTPTSASVQAWRALEPKITVTGVTINSPPVVSFAVTDANGAAVVGLGNKSQSSSAVVAGLVNLRFTLAKLVPASASEPSKWVSYLVVKPPTVTQRDGTVLTSDSCTPEVNATTKKPSPKWCGTYPTTDQEGTLVDNGDGTYKYTFARDVKEMANIVASLVDSTDTTAPIKKKSDLGDVSYDASLTHRLGIQISGAAPGTGSNTPTGTTVLPGVNIAIPANVVFDFVPAGGPVASTRSIVDISSCASCHNGKGLAHGGGRKDPNYCVTCHTDQVKYGMSAEAARTGLALTGKTQNTTSVLDGRAIGNFPNFMHKVHMGSELSFTGYNYIPSGTFGVTTGSNKYVAGMNFNEVEWIQDPRNCTKCHSGDDKTDINQATKTKDGNNWKTKPSRLACGACHDALSFTEAETSQGSGVTASGRIYHKGGQVTDDSACASCHGGGLAESVDVAHRTQYPTANNSVQIDGISTISYEIAKVTVNASKQPVITFRIMKDGAAVTSFNTPTPAQNSTTGVYSVPGTFEPITGFNTGPTFYVAYAVPQDGITEPADFNTYQSVSLTNLLVTSGYPKAGTLVASADTTYTASAGYLTATLTGSAGQLVTTSPTTPVACPEPNGTQLSKAKTVSGYCANPSLIVIPPNAKMVTGAMIGNFNQVAFTAGTKAASTYGTSYPTGLVIKSPLKKLVASGYTARRVVVDTDKCESCHEQLGTAVDFHGGARNDATACAICHNPNRTSSGWSANASTFIHGIHAGTSPETVATITAGLNGDITAVVGVPGTGRGGAGTGYSTGKRTIPFSWHRAGTATVPTWNAAAVVYPGILKRCDNCHVPNAVNFGASGATLLPNLLWSTSATGMYSSTDTAKVYARDPVTGLLKYIVADATDAGNTANGKYVTGGTNYGTVFSFTPEGSAVPRIVPFASAGTNILSPVFGTNQVVAPSGGTIIPADGHNLVESPVSSACFACHDTSTARSHMTQYGGVIYGVRSTYLPFTNGVRADANNETCLICHGMGRDQDAAVVHAK